MINLGGTAPYLPTLSEIASAAREAVTSHPVFLTLAILSMGFLGGLILWGVA